MASKAETKAGPDIKPAGAGGASKGADSKFSGTGSRLLFANLIAMALFAGATYVALNQYPNPNPYTKPTFWENLYYPQEKNAFMRLPTINGNLNDIFVLPNGEKLWAVGDNGLIVYSPDGGYTWQQQGFPDAEIDSNEVPLSQLIQPDINRQLFSSPLSFSLFTPAQAQTVNAPTNAKAQNRQQTIQELKRADAERNNIRQETQRQPQQKTQITEPQQVQQQLKQTQPEQPQQREEQAIIEEEPFYNPVPKSIPETIPTPKDLPNLQSVYFVNEATGFIVGSNGTILKTVDGGQQWQLQVSGTTARLSSVVFLSGGQRGWAVGEGKIILSTINGGQQWQPQEVPSTRSLYHELLSVTFVSAEKGWAVGDGGIILATTNGGKEWQSQPRATSQDLNSVTFLADGQRGWVVGNNGVVMTTLDAGKTWTTQIVNELESLKSITFTGNGLTGIAVSDVGKIFTTSNGGEDWQKHSDDMTVGLDSVSFAQNSQQAWAVGERGKIITTKDGGQNWYAQSKYGWFSVLEFSRDGNKNKMLAADSIVLASNDMGKTWEAEEKNNAEDRYSETIFEDGQRGWSINANAQVDFTSDGGQTWQLAMENVFNPLNIFTFSDDGRLGWMPGSRNISFTNDGGQSWKEQPTDATRYFASVFFLTDNQRGWAVGDLGAIVSTNNGGQTWESQISKTSVGLSAVVFSDKGLRGWAVGDQGTILTTTDGGENWQQQESNTKVTLVSLHFADDLRGLVIGDELTVLYTIDGGETWQFPQYSKTLAYWFWLLCLSLFLFALWLITKKPFEASQPKETVADLLASDKPLEPGDPDPLNFNSIALGLSRFMRNPATEPPLTVAITGAWGSGKSSLMNLLYHDLKSYGFTPVWFNAWHHQKGEQLLASLYANIKEQAIPGWFKFYKLMPVGLIFRLNLLAKRIKNHWLLTLVSAILTAFVIRFVIDTDFSWADLSPNKLLDNFVGEAGGSFENLLILILGGPIAILIRWLQAFGISPEKLMTHRSDKQHPNKIDPSARQTFAREFKDVSSCLDTGRMVIFIDDLDRCSKENVVDILEAMNFLSVSGDCYIVVGMDETWVKICIENSFPDMVAERNNGATENTNEKSFADNYLEKMINIPVPIPTLKSSDTMDLLLPQESFMPPSSLFKKLCSVSSEFLMRYRIVFSLIICAVCVGLFVKLIPQSLFTVTEVENILPEKLYEWDNVSVENFSVVDGEPEVYIAIDQAQQTQNLNYTDKEVADTDNQKDQWRLTLEGNRDIFEKEGITIANLGNGKSSASLVLKRLADDTLINTKDPSEPGPLPSPEPKGSEKNAKAELIPGSEDSVDNDYLLPLFSFLVFLFGLVVYSLKIPNRFVEDSPYFKDALSIWQPWISLQRSTPRAIKRYINYVRYLAMRYKTPESDSIAKGQLAELLATDKTKQEAEEIDEENLVALSAIYAIEPSWLTDENLLSKLKEGLITQMVESKFKSAIGYFDTDQYGQVSESLQSSIEKHKNRFGDSVFSNATVERFLEINASTTFN